MANLADLYFPPSIEDEDPILHCASYILSAEAYWRQKTYNFISEKNGAIAQPSPTTQVQMRQFELLRFPPPIPLIQPPPPALPRWRHIAEDHRIRSFCFIHSNIIHLAEPDKPTDPFQTVIKPEENYLEK
jgi:hypothetical protein